MVRIRGLTCGVDVEDLYGWSVPWFAGYGIECSVRWSWCPSRVRFGVAAASRWSHRGRLFELDRRGLEVQLHCGFEKDVARMSAARSY